MYDWFPHVELVWQLGLTREHLERVAAGEEHNSPDRLEGSLLLLR